MPNLVTVRGQNLKGVPESNITTRQATRKKSIHHLKKSSYYLCENGEREEEAWSNVNGVYGADNVADEPEHAGTGVSAGSKWVQGVHCEAYELGLPSVCEDYAMHGTVFVGWHFPA